MWPLTRYSSLEPSSVPSINIMTYAGLWPQDRREEHGHVPSSHIVSTLVKSGSAILLRKFSEVCKINCLMPCLHALLTFFTTWISVLEFLQERKSRLKTQNPNRSLPKYRTGKSKLKSSKREEIRILETMSQY